MGGSSKSESKQSTTQTDRRIAATDSALVAAEGASISSTTSIESADPEIAQAAFAEAFGFGGVAAGEAFDFGAEALEFGETALATTERALVGAQEGFSSGLQEQRRLVESVVTQGSEELQGLKSLLLTTAAIAVGAFFFMRR